MARRALFLWVVLGLVLAGSVVLAKVLVDAGEVVASPAAATTSVADSETILPLVDNEGSNGLPICTYPDNCPPPESVDCMIQVRAFGTVIGVDDSQGEPIRFFDPNYRITVTECEVAGIVFSLDQQYEIDRGSGPVLEVDGLPGVCPNDPYAYRIDVLGADGKIIDVEKRLLGDEQGACASGGT